MGSRLDERDPAAADSKSGSLHPYNSVPTSVEADPYPAEIDHAPGYEAALEQTDQRASTSAEALLAHALWLYGMDAESADSDEPLDQRAVDDLFALYCPE